MAPKLHNLRIGVCHFYLPPPQYPFDGTDAPITSMALRENIRELTRAWLTHKTASVSLKLSFDPSEGNQGTKPEVDALRPAELSFAKVSMSHCVNQELQRKDGEGAQDLS